ncbi:MAG: hypothetical protein K8R87_03580 [Verrucomicrobia bacterium]|nr:hypothetical protein [Verrucomicrobiota bacterium]
MKWIGNIVVLVVLYVLSIGPVAYFKVRSGLGPSYVAGSMSINECTSYMFFRGTAIPPYFTRMPEWMQTVYAPLSSLVRNDSVPGRWVNDYTTWWISLAY